VTAGRDEPVWFPRAAIEAAHADQVRTHGGQQGLRAESLLDSGLERPRSQWLCEADADIAALAASYGYGLGKNHPFVDGNKRIGLIAANMFLMLNGLEIEALEPEVVQITLQVADGSVGEHEFAEWIRSRMVPFDAGSLLP
jgi:death-on-curing protein